ncbi:MAG: MlaD family protein [Pseudomonadota bacterium]
METRANYVAIGTFVVLVMLSILGALYWLYKASEPGATNLVRIIFPEPVTGLSTGGAVLFNGIRVGEVARLEFSPQGGDDVDAIIRVSERAPIKTDTVAKLGFQGLTGVAYISMTGGSNTSPSLFSSTAEGEMPTIRAATSAFTNVLDSAQSVLARINTTLDEVNGFITQNRPNLDQVVSNVTDLTGTLNAAAPQISSMIDNISSAAREVAGAAPQISGVVDRANEILAAVEPQRVTSIVENVDTFASNLPAIGDDARTVVANVNGLVTRLDSVAGTLGEAVQAVETLVSDVDPSALSDIVESVRTATEVIAGRATAIGSTLDDAAVIAADVRAVTSTLAARRDEIGEAIDQATGLIEDARRAVASAAPAITQVGEALAVVTPERVEAILSNVDQIAADIARQLPDVNSFITEATSAARSVASVSETVAARRDAIDQAVVDAGALLENLRTASAGAPQVVDEVNARLGELGGILQAIDPDAVAQLVQNAEAFSQTIAAQSGRIDSLMTAAEAAARRVEAIASSFAINVPQIERVIDRVEAAVTSAQEFAAALPQFAETLRPAVENVSAIATVIDPDALGNIVASADSFMEGLAEQREPIADLVANAGDAARQVADLGATLNDQGPQIASLIENASAAAAGASDLANELVGLTRDVSPAVRQLAASIEVVTPARVNDVLTQVQLIVTGLRQQGPQIDAIIADVRGTATAARTVATSLADRAPELQNLIDNAASAANDVSNAAADLPGLIDAIEPGVRNAGAALSALSPDDIAQIQRDVASFADALATQRTEVEALIISATRAAENIETVARSVAQRTPQIETIIDGTSRAVGSAEEFAAALPGFADTLRPGIENLSSVLSAVDPATITEIVNGAGDFVGVIASEGETIRVILNEAQVAAAGASRVVTTLSERTPQIEGAIDNASAAIASARGFADSLPEIAATLQPGIENLSNALSAIDPETIDAIVADVAALSGVLAQEAPRISVIMDNLTLTSENASVIAATFRGQLDTITQGIDDAGAALTNARQFASGLPALLDEVRPGVQNLSAVLSGIDPDAVSEIVNSIESITATLRDARGEFAQTLRSARLATENIATVSEAVTARLDQIDTIITSTARFTSDISGTGAQFSGLVTTARETLDAVRNTVNALNADAVNEIIGNVRTVTETFSSRANEIGVAIDNVSNAARGLSEGLGTLGGADGTLRQILDQAKNIATNLEDASAQVRGVVSRAGDLLEGPIQTMVANVTLAAIDIRAVSAAFASRADEIAGGLSKFSTTGLDDFRAVLNQGRSTLSAIETAVSSIDRDPSRVIFGGAKGPTYQPQRR